MSNTKEKGYYLAEPSGWPMMGCVAIFTLLFGAVHWLHGETLGPYIFVLGACFLVYMLFGWFGTVVRENRAGLLLNQQVDRSFRWSMTWFIFTEVMFFGGFFGALFYVRHLAVHWLGGTTPHGDMTHLLLWPQFKAAWPLLANPDPSTYSAPTSVMETWDIPAINTLILLTSGATITVAHWALVKEKRAIMIIFQLMTVLLGMTFLRMQAHEYVLAYTTKGLTLSSGIYGTTFFMLTGFHALHVTIGTIGLIVILWRMCKGDFSKHDHFAFAAISWYWHFVDVVWLLLFVIVYWL